MMLNRAKKKKLNISLCGRKEQEALGKPTPYPKGRCNANVPTVPEKAKAGG